MSSDGINPGFLYIGVGIALAIGLLFQTFKSPFTLIIAYLALFSVLMYVAISLHGPVSNATGMYKGPIFHFKSGPVGTLLTGPVTASKGMVLYVVSLHSSEIPKALRKKWWQKSFGELVSFTQEFKIINYEDLFEQLPIKNCESSEGAIFYHGSIDGRPIIDDKTYLENTVKEKNRQLMNSYTLLRTVNKQLANITGKSNKDMYLTVQEARDITDLQKHIELHVGKSGQSNAFGSIADPPES